MIVEIKASEAGGRLVWTEITAWNMSHVLLYEYYTKIPAKTDIIYIA